MRLKKSAVLLACLLAATAIGGAGAVTASSVEFGHSATSGRQVGQRPASKPKRSLTSLKEIRAHLRAMGVDPARVVVQRAERNYAGPNCPGANWNCTTAKNVVQVAQPGGVNRFVATTQQQQTDCSVNQPAPPGGGNNKIHCRQRADTVPVATQDCGLIVQTNTTGKNEAHVDQVIYQRSGPTQAATQDCRIEQTNGSGDNLVHVRQSISQTTNETVAGAQRQDAYQVLELEQSTGGSGKNTAHVDQSQDQGMHGAATDQKQNTGNAAAPLPDCAGTEPPNQPNQCVAIAQDAVNGTNDLHLKQSIDENAQTRATATQSQGSKLGGIEGDVHQTIVSGTGSSHNNADERKHQIAHGGAGSSQTQIDPTRCCSYSQVGGVNNREDIDQNIHQQANGDDFFQEADVIAQSNTGGHCTLTHNVHQNDARTNVTFSNEPCPTTQMTTSCTSTGVSIGTSFAPEGRDSETYEAEAQLAGNGPPPNECTTVCPAGFVFDPQSGQCEQGPPVTTTPPPEILGPAPGKAPYEVAPSWNA